MEKLLPGPADFSPVLKSASALLDRLGDIVQHVTQVNTALYVQGFLAGVTVCATVLMALWAFSGSRKS